MSVLKYRNARTRRGLLLSTAIALSIPALPAWAQDSENEAGERSAQILDVITVTARFREETVQEIGGGVSGIGGDELRERGLTDFDDIVGLVPGLNVRDSGPNQNDISIRGVSRGTITDFSLGTGPLVTTYFDDIPVSSFAATQKDFNTFDIGRLEVLRGPQPTFFGEGAVGGVVRYF